MARLSLPQWFSSRVHSPQNDKWPTGDQPFPEKMSVKEVLCRLLLTLIFVAYGAILVSILVRSFSGEEQPENPTQQCPPHPALPAPVPGPPPPPLTTTTTSTTTTSRRICNNLLKPLTSEEVENQLFLGRWVLQEAYSTDQYDQYALTISKSSWLEFYNDTNTGTLNLTMAHMLLRPENKTIWCVYHHFANMTFRNDTLHLNLFRFSSSAQVRFVKTCNECLALTAKAHVPGYPPLTYLLVYGLKGQLNEYFMQRTRQQAECLNFTPPPPHFHYKGDHDFCPEKWNMSFENSVNRRSRGLGCPFSPGR